MFTRNVYKLMNRSHVIQNEMSFIFLFFGLLFHLLIIVVNKTKFLLKLETIFVIKSIQFFN